MEFQGCFKNLSLKINRTSTPAIMCFLHTFLYQILVFQAPQDQIQDNKSIKREPRNKHGKETQFLLDSAEQTLKIETRTLTQIDENPTPDPNAAAPLVR